jgi:hypothetical protein
VHQNDSIYIKKLIFIKYTGMGEKNVYIRKIDTGMGEKHGKELKE